MVSFEGLIESIKYHNPENGYTVATLASKKELVTVVGSMPSVYEGENIKVSGEWTYHNIYGRQLKVSDIQRISPGTVDAIESYLSSGMFKGIGKAMAKRITDKFGEETLDIIMYHPQRLSEIKGIGKKKALELAVEFELQRDLREITMFLQGCGLGPVFATKVYKEFGGDAVSKIKENPYLLADHIQGIGFKTADRIAFKLGIERDSEFRIKSGITYTLYKASSAGHVYLPLEELINEACEILGVGNSRIRDVFTNLVFDRGIVNDGGNIYLSSLFSSEKNAAFKISELTHLSNAYGTDEIEEYISEYEKTEKIVLEEEQKQALHNSIKNGVSIITGGPGTGKTTIIKGLLFILDKLKLSYALCAPTGRAAKRMEEATGRESKTIHRLLEAGYMDNSRELEFRKNSMNPLEYDFVIVDEMSMVDILLFNSLLTAIMPGTRIVMVGDKDQLPSVGPGSVLRDMLECGAVSYMQLRHIFRQDEQSLIVLNAHRINSGQMPIVNNSSKDFFVIPKRRDEIVEYMIKLMTHNLPDKYDVDWRENIWVMTPIRKGELGVEGLNLALRHVLNPPSDKKKELVFAENVFREGDRVMQIRNNYDIKWYKYNNIDIMGEGLYNGDVGFIDLIDDKEDTIEVIFDADKVGIYERLNFEELEPAFASTIHKTQGSEFDIVIIPLFNAPRILLTRNLLYTALTRAKKMAIFIGDSSILKTMVSNETENKRYTSLAKRLRQFINREI